jgi:hypothetical protein
MTTPFVTDIVGSGCRKKEDIRQARPKGQVLRRKGCDPGQISGENQNFGRSSKASMR